MGWLLTAALLMLGAPFWFDLLSKLVSLRNTGKAPDPAAKDDASATAAVIRAESSVGASTGSGGTGAMSNATTLQQFMGNTPPTVAAAAAPSTPKEARRVTRRLAGR